MVKPKPPWRDVDVDGPLNASASPDGEDGVDRPSFRGLESTVVPSLHGDDDPPPGVEGWGGRDGGRLPP